MLQVDFDTLIPGHGRLMTRADVIAYKVRFEEMNRRMRELVKADGSGVPLGPRAAGIRSAISNESANSIFGAWSAPFTAFTGLIGSRLAWNLTDKGRDVFAWYVY